MLTLSEATDLCQLLSDATRLRLLGALSVEPLTVAELVKVLGVAQSRVSTHLGKLKEFGLLRAEPFGASTLYSRESAGRAEAVWAFLAGQTEDALLAADRARVAEVVAARAETWADQTAGRMAGQYSPGRTWAAFARSAVGLVEVGDVLDIASGDGALAELLAPHARSVTCLDLSERVVAAGRARLAHLPNLRFHHGDMHSLPFEPAAFDAALLMGALCHAREPRRALAEAARVLRPGGRLVGSDLAAHTHPEAVERYNHLQPGFAPDALAALLETCGFIVDFCEPTQREARPPHFTIITFHARRAP